ncbi:protein kinase domain-containing protein [Streptomyces viridiviolaceus]
MRRLERDTGIEVHLRHGIPWRHQASLPGLAALRDAALPFTEVAAAGPRVIDFGIARSAVDATLTTAGAALGTPGFMAPEQLTSVGPEITGAADVFAVGGVLVFAATGTGPFGIAHPQILMYRTVYEEPELAGLPQGLAGARVSEDHLTSRRSVACRTLVTCTEVGAA